MGRPQRHVYHIEPSRFPPDFPERLERLRDGVGFSWRALARALRVDTRTLRRWRNGTTPGPGHLYRLFCFALERGLLHCLLPGASRACAAEEPGDPARGDEPAVALGSGGDS